MNKYRHSSMHKLLGPPPLVLFDGEETRFSKKIFPEHSTDKIKLCWESRPMNRVNDFEFQKVNNTNQEAIDQYTKDSYQLPQIYKRKNMLNNECFAISPQMTVESETKFGKYARRYTQDTDLFSTKIPVHTQYSQHSSAYGQFYLQSDLKLQKTKPIYTYHTAKSQILGNKRLEYIKLRQEAD